ncbi:MAG: DUF4412 domain-containing protein [Bacteroidota bacterium]|jgi:hypothetical protein
MLRKLFTIYFMLLAVLAGAQNFEGIIEFKKQQPGDSVNLVYSVNGNQVRVDEIRARSHNIFRSFLLDLKAGSCIFINHAKKEWTQLGNTGKPVVPASITVESTKESKSLFGNKCNKHIVKNTADNSSIHYYVSSGRYMFFVPMLELLNQREDFSTNYLALPVKDGSFPFLAVKYDAAGKEVGRLEVTRIEKKVVSASVFDVPKDYKEVK